MRSRPRSERQPAARSRISWRGSGRSARAARERSLSRAISSAGRRPHTPGMHVPNTLRYRSRRRSRSKRSCPQSGLRKPSTPGREIRIWRQRRVATAKHASRHKRPRATGATRWRSKRESSSGPRPVDVRIAGSMTKSRVACALSTRKNIGRCAWL